VIHAAKSIATATNGHPHEQGFSQYETSLEGAIKKPAVKGSQIFETYVDSEVAAVPEPSTLLLLVLGLGASSPFRRGFSQV
jgi:hypothetical protein